MRIKKQIHGIILNRKQKKINKEYNEKGLTDEILEKQIEINTRRNELDISDKTQKNDEGFVQ